MWNNLRELIQERGINGKVIVSAELGLNHNGDMALAMKMIEATAEAGCQAVKVQNYRTGDVAKSRLERISVDGASWNAWELFSRCELDIESLRLLKFHAEQCDLIFHSTPTSEQGVRDLFTLEVKIIKIASDIALEPDIVNYARRLHRHIVISTGCLGFAVLPQRLAFDDVVLHCVREYPTPREKANLARIGELRLVLGKYQPQPLIGYSDHTEGIECAVSAVKDYGAVWVEKHFTLDKTLPGPDHRWSVDPKEMAELVRCLKT